MWLFGHVGIAGRSSRHDARLWLRPCATDPREHMTQYPEGLISIRLVPGGPGALRAELSSTRPLSAARVFEGKTVAQTLRVLPLLFRVCATAQGAAAAAALESAWRLKVPQADGIARATLVMIETWREHILRILTSWPEATGSIPDPSLVAGAVRLAREIPALIYPAADAFTPGGGRLEVDTDALRDRLGALLRLSTTGVFGMPPGEWLALDNLADARTWASSGRGPAADFVGFLLDREWADAGRARVPALPPLTAQEVAARMTAPDADDFVARPRWRGDVFETGAYARAAAHPLVTATRLAHGDALLARTFARLVEVAAIPGRVAELLERLIGAERGDAGESTPGDGTGVGQTEAARGRLAHHVVLDGDRVASYRILAPTEWNFHPDGVLAQSLGTLPACSGLRQLAGLVVEAVDPCVGYDLTVSADA